MLVFGKQAFGCCSFQDILTIPIIHNLTPYSHHISFLTIPPHLQLISSTTTTTKCTLRSVLLNLELFWRNNTLLDLQNSSYHTQSYSIIAKYYSSQMEYRCIKVINKYIHPSKVCSIYGYKILKRHQVSPAWRLDGEMRRLIIWAWPKQSNGNGLF